MIIAIKTVLQFSAHHVILYYMISQIWESAAILTDFLQKDKIDNKAEHTDFRITKIMQLERNGEQRDKHSGSNRLYSGYSDTT